MNRYFFNRERCPACISANSISLRKIAYNEAPMAEHFAQHYSAFDIEKEYLKYMSGNYYILNECLDCGLIYQRDVPNDFLIEKIYNEWLDAEKVLERHDRKRQLNFFISLAGDIVKVIRHFGVLPSELQFLDFGMGLGTWCQLAKGYGSDVYGTDISKVRCEYVKASGIKVISIDELDAYKFDYINADQVFEHLATPLETLCGLREILKPNGIIKISVPNGCDIKSRLEVNDWRAPDDSETSLGAVAPFEHINCYNYDVLVNMAAMAGFTPISLHEEVLKTKKSGAMLLARKAYRFVWPRKTTIQGLTLFFSKQGSP